MTMLRSRRPVALATLLLLGAVLALDLATSSPPNPYRQPAFLALGSGEKADGAFCAAPPPG
ncbi:MAG: hypothetical protein RIE83_13225 [Thalassobaculaceae bacterium]